MAHQPDERDLFRRLGDDTRRARLAAPEELRRWSDRRTAVRAAAGSVAVVVAVAGIVVAANGLSGRAAPGPAGDPTPTVTSSDEPSPDEPSPTEPSPTEPSPTEPVSSEPDPTDPVTSSSTPSDAIPAAAWLGENELGFEPAPIDAVDVLTPCGRSAFEWDLFDGAVLSGGTRQGNFHAPGTPAVNTPDGTLAQTVALMTSEKDARAVWYGLQEAVKDCPEETEEEPGALRYSLVDNELPSSSARPDLHLLIKESTSFEYLFGSPPDAGPDYIDTYVSVLQVDDVVTFLELRGWEASETDLEDVHRLAGLATAKLLDWRAGA